MAKLTNSRNLYNLVRTEIIDKFSGDKEFLGTITSDFICLKIFAEFDLNMNNIIKDFLISHDIDVKEKEIGRFKPSEIRKELKKRFSISMSELAFLENNHFFTDCILNRNRLGHTAQSSSISFEKALDFLNEADNILEKTREVLKIHGKINKKEKVGTLVFNTIKAIINTFQ